MTKNVKNFDCSGEGHTYDWNLILTLMAVMKSRNFNYPKYLTLFGMTMTYYYSTQSGL